MTDSLSEQLRKLGIAGSKSIKANETNKPTKNARKKKRKRKEQKALAANHKSRNPSKSNKRKPAFHSGISTEAIQAAYSQTSSIGEAISEKPPLPHIKFPEVLSLEWKPGRNNYDALQQKDSGCCENLNWDGDVNNLDQLRVGFDFGTSSIKVMIQTSDESFIPVKFTNSPSNPYFLPSTLFVNEDIASIHSNGSDQIYRDLKIPLLGEAPSEDDLILAAAFIGCTLRYIRSWLFNEYFDAFKNKLLIWEINFGIPASIHNLGKSRQRFEELFELGYAASKIESDGISICELKKLYLEREWEKEEYVASKQHQIALIPEIAAQIYAVMRSDIWDKSSRLMSVMDIGAGTVDHGVFSVTGQDLKQGLHFLNTRVENNGVVHFHRNRIQYLLDCPSNADNIVTEYLQNLLKISDINQSIPDSWTGYIPKTLLSASFDPDKEFIEEYDKNTLNLFRATKQHKYPRPIEDWLELPVIICGGGSEIENYRTVFEATPPSNAFNKPTISFRLTNLSTPSKVRDCGIDDNTYRRLSLAYGLSFSIEQYPKLVITNKIPNFVSGRATKPIQDMVTKDSV
ncbi:MAG: hypothetical protein GY861_26285 [bacterium]|nr:hypothetical protein [bacterium]